MQSFTAGTPDFHTRFKKKKKLDSFKLLSWEVLEGNKTPVLLQGRESSFYHLAAFSSILFLHSFLYKVLRYVINLSLGAIGHALDVFFWLEKEVVI